jgi:hypothetical protein
MIGDLRIGSSYALIIDESGRESGNSVYIGGGTVEGWNSKRVVVRERDYAKIYDERGRETGSMIWLGEGRSIKAVTQSAILVQEGSYVRRFSIDGRDTGEMTFMG